MLQSFNSFIFLSFFFLIFSFKKCKWTTYVVNNYNYEFQLGSVNRKIKSLN